MAELAMVRCRLCPTDINTYEVVRQDNGARLASFDISDELGEVLALMLFQGLMTTGALGEEDFLNSFNTPTAH